VKQQKSIYSSWRKSPNLFRTYVNDQGDTYSYLAEEEAVINGEHIFGADEIRRKIAELSNN